MSAKSRLEFLLGYSPEQASNIFSMDMGKGITLNHLELMGEDIYVNEFIDNMIMFESKSKTWFDKVDRMLVEKTKVKETIKEIKTDDSNKKTKKIKSKVDVKPKQPKTSGISKSSKNRWA
jgi:hypothetical protein